MKEQFEDHSIYIYIIMHMNAQMRVCKNAFMYTYKCLGLTSHCLERYNSSIEIDDIH